MSNNNIINILSNNSNINIENVMFNSISNGEYANTLFAQFSKERVQQEMNDFLSKDFMPRFGGGIGMTRMIRAMKLSKLI